MFSFLTLKVCFRISTKILTIFFNLQNYALVSVILKVKNELQQHIEKMEETVKVSQNILSQNRQVKGLGRFDFCFYYILTYTCTDLHCTMVTKGKVIHFELVSMVFC